MTGTVLSEVSVAEQKWQYYLMEMKQYMESMQEWNKNKETGPENKKVGSPEEGILQKEECGHSKGGVCDSLPFSVFTCVINSCIRVTVSQFP